MFCLKSSNLVKRTGQLTCLTIHIFSLPIPVRLCSHQGMSLTNDELEQQLIQLADALAKATEMTATAFEERDQQIQTLLEKIETLESQLKTND